MAGSTTDFSLSRRGRSLHLFHVEHLRFLISMKNACAVTGKQLVEREVEVFVAVDESDFLNAKFGHDLSTRTARGDGRCGIGDHDDASKVFRTLSDRLMDGDAFGAEGESIRKILDIAAAELSAIVALYGCAHKKLRVRRMGVAACGPG
jgi:hypothetical protein